MRVRLAFAGVQPTCCSSVRLRKVLDDLFAFCFEVIDNVVGELGRFMGFVFGHEKGSFAECEDLVTYPPKRVLEEPVTANP